MTHRIVKWHKLWYNPVTSGQYCLICLIYLLKYDEVQGKPIVESLGSKVYCYCQRITNSVVAESEGSTAGVPKPPLDTTQPVPANLSLTYFSRQSYY
jgi:hypothetical protein